MATAWNIKKVHEILKTKVKVDVDKIYADLKQIDTAIEALAAVDKTASSKTGEDVANFSGHKARAYFNVLKKKGGYYEMSETFYGTVYRFCNGVAERAQMRAVKDNTTGYKTYTKWIETLPTQKAYTFNKIIFPIVREDVVNISGNVLTLKDNVEKAYNVYIKDMTNLSTDLRTLKKYVPDGLDNSIAKVINRIDTRKSATVKRRDQLTRYMYDVIVSYLLENKNDESVVSKVESGLSDDATQTIDG